MIFGQVQKNKTNIIRATTETYKGKEAFHIRTYYEGEDGEYKPTSKGVTFKPELLGKLIEVLQKAEKKLNSKKAA